MNEDSLPGFDDDVIRAMARWPDVPQCFGWLGLDRRGGWRIRGETITHARAVAFLGRHYRGDENGRWYVQNGPQQVFVDLDYTPWVYRYDTHAGFVTHTGIRCTALTGACLDDEGNLLVATSLGIGIVDDRDLAACEALLELRGDVAIALTWGGTRHVLESVARDAVPGRYGFVPTPRA
ncbi:MAG: DUF2946 family protein [Gammaproteobacteria bacterium]